jgi:hypothetical protein
MNRSNLVAMGIVTMAAVSGCSSAAPPETTTLQTQAVAAVPSVALPTPHFVIPATSMAPSPLGTITPPAASLTVARPALGDATERAKLLSMALGVSSRAGVASPTTVHAVAAADRQSAESILSGAIIPDHSPVYVIKVTGGPFTAPQHPPGAPAAQGNVLTITIDVATHHVMDIGYGDVDPDLSQFGTASVDLMAP